MKQSEDLKIYQEVEDLKSEGLTQTQAHMLVAERRTLGYHAVRLRHYEIARALQDKKPEKKAENKPTYSKEDYPPERPPIHAMPLRAAVFDIETTDFKTNGYNGMLVCCCILPLDSDDIQTVVIDFNDKNDQRVLFDTIKALQEFDILIGHNIMRFDLAWLNSRIEYHNMPSTRRWYVIDTYELSRRAKLKTRKSLGNLIDFYHIGDSAEKTAIQESSWSEVRSRFRAEFDRAIDDITYHCEQDVTANRLVYHRLHTRLMSARFSSSTPIKIYDQGAGAFVDYYSGDFEGV